MMGWRIECGMVCSFVFIFFYLCLLGELGTVSFIFRDLLLVGVLWMGSFVSTLPNFLFLFF